MHAPAPATLIPPDTREALLARVRASLGGATVGTPEPPPIIDAVMRMAGPGDDLVRLFRERAEAVGMKVHPVESAGLQDRLVELLRGLGAKRVVLGLSQKERSARLDGVLGHAGFRVLDSTDGLDAQFDVDVGITDVHAALAETGTLICSTDEHHSRGVSLIPPIHIAIVREEDIVPDMLDYWADIAGKDGRGLPSSLAFITGPSKTADIEGVLVTGVHGPGQVHILFVAS